jgi:hypothetical protein
VLHLIKMWLDCPVEETDQKGRKKRTTEARDNRQSVSRETFLSDWRGFPYIQLHPARFPSPQIQFLEEIIALVVDDDEGREILDFNLPDRFHTEFGIFVNLDLFDATLGEPRRRPADRAEIKAMVPRSGLAHFLRAIALSQHHQRAAGRLELIDIGIHAPRRAE